MAPMYAASPRWILLAVLLVSCGCKDNRPVRVPVSGQILIDGEPVEHGFVQVIPENDRAATGKLGAQGRFQLTTFEPNDGCVKGKHRVAVIAVQSDSPTSQTWLAPQEYADVETSGLEVEIKGPTKDLTIELNWDGKSPVTQTFDAE